MKKSLSQEKWVNPDTNALFEATLKLQNLDEARRFFRDLLTEQEILEFARRWKAARMLAQKQPYTKVLEETGMSSTTVARVQKWLQRGMGGYRLIIKRFVTDHR